MENAFGKRLKEMREQKCLTMEMLAIDMNQRYGLKLNKGTISRWESGASDPAMSYVIKVADYFNVSIDYCAGLTDTPAPSRLLTYARGIEKREPPAAPGRGFAEGKVWES